MSKILKFTREIACQYKNETSMVQIIRLIDDSKHYLERSISPQNVIKFKASYDAFLGVYEYNQPTNMLAERIPCENLSILHQSQEILAA